MKKFTKLFLVVALSLTMMFTVFACGAAGATGPAGKDGVNGADGVSPVLGAVTGREYQTAFVDSLLDFRPNTVPAATTAKPAAFALEILSGADVVEVGAEKVSTFVTYNQVKAIKAGTAVIKYTDKANAGNAFVRELTVYDKFAGADDTVLVIPPTTTTAEKLTYTVLAKGYTNAPGPIVMTVGFQKGPDKALVGSKILTIRVTKHSESTYFASASILTKYLDQMAITQLIPAFAAYNFATGADNSALIKAAGEKLSIFSGATQSATGLLNGTMAAIGGYMVMMTPAPPVVA